MKKSLSFILILLLIVSCVLSACARGGDPASGTDPANPYDNEYGSETGEEEATHPGAYDIDTQLEYYTLNYHYSTGDDAGLPVIDGYGTDEESSKASAMVEIAIYVGGLTQKESFQFRLKTAVDPQFAEEAAMNAAVWTHARLERLFLFSVEAYADGTEVYYIYDNESGNLTCLGKMSVLRITGNYLVARYGEESDGAVNIFSWQGEKLYTYPGVTDIDRYNGDLYLITDSQGMVQRVDEDRFYEKEPDFTGEKYCDTGDYSAAFGYYNTGILTLTRKDGGDFRIVQLEEAPELLGKLAQEPAAGLSPITESCGAFSVTLPGFWSGHYICEKNETGMVFSYQRKEGNPLQLMSFTLVEWGEVLDALGGAVIYGEYRQGDTHLYLAVSGAESYQEDNNEAELCWAMLNCMDQIAESVQPVPADAGFSVFDFTSRLGSYTGKTAAGDTYGIEFTITKNNLLMGALKYACAEGESGSAEIYAVMYGSMGYLVWQQPDGAQGAGVLQLKNGSLLLELKGENGGWAQTEEFTLKKQ